MDKLSPDQRRKNMQAVRSTGSKIEVTLAKALYKHNLRYRKNDKSVFGKPDLTFKKYKIAIFVDSEFWHGKDWEKNILAIKSNRDFWVAKIERNIERDKEVNEYLSHEGWTILRFWGKQIQNDLQNCIEIIISHINESASKTKHQ